MPAFPPDLSKSSLDDYREAMAEFDFKMRRLLREQDDEIEDLRRKVNSG